MDDERDLVKRCLKREVKAEKQLYDLYVHKMFGICLRYSGNAMEAEDLMQEGFLRVFSLLHTFRFDGSLEGWVFHVFIHSAINYTKRHLRFKAEVRLENYDHHATFHEESLSKLSHDEMLKIIHDLPPGYRTVFNLYAIDGYHHKEIGKMLGISEETSKSQLYMAKRRIREILIARTNFGLHNIAKS